MIGAEGRHAVGKFFFFFGGGGCWSWGLGVRDGFVVVKEFKRWPDIIIEVHE